jgi:hypothetical protein
MLTIKVFLEDNGSSKELKKDFPLYQGAYQDKLLNIYVPTSILAPQFTSTSASGQVTAEYVAGTAVKIGMTYVDRDGSIHKSQSYYVRYLKTLTYQNVEYALFERKLPKEFTLYAGQGQNAPTMIVNVVNVDTSTTPPTLLSIVTSQEFKLDVLPSTELDRDDVQVASELDTLEAQITAINQTLAKKQNIDIPNSMTDAKTVEGAINELHTDIIDLTATVEENKTETDGKISALDTRVSKNETDIASINARLETVEDYIGTINGTTLPTDEQLTAFVVEKTSRQPKGGDYIIFNQENGEGKVTASYKYLFSANDNKWHKNEIPPMEKASNGSIGLVEGTYGLDLDYDTVVDIVGGQIKRILVKDNEGTYRDIREYQNTTNTNMSYLVSQINARITAIIDGTTAVGMATKASQDAKGNVIDETYLTQSAGVTKRQMKDYALPREFNDTYFLATAGYQKTIPTTPASGIQFSVATNAVKDYTLFTAQKTTDAEFQLASKNSSGNAFYVSSNVDANVYFRLTTQYKVSGEDWKDLSIELSDLLSLTAGNIRKITFGSSFTGLSEVISLSETDLIRQVLEVVTQASTPTTFSVYSNETYPSTFNLNTQTQVIEVVKTGRIGQQPSITSVGATLSNNVLTFSLPTNIELANNIECEFILKYNQASIGKDVEIALKQGDQTIRLATPYNFESGNPTFDELTQLPIVSNGANGTTIWFKGFVKIDEGDNYTVIVDEDDLTMFANNMDILAHRELIMGASGTVETGAVDFVVTNPTTYLAYRVNQTTFTLDLELPVVGEVDKTKPVAITFGDTTYYLYNFLNSLSKLTFGDLLSENHTYSEETGYRFVFDATFFSNSDITGFAIMPVFASNKANKPIAVEITDVPATATNGTLTPQQLATLKADDANYIVFDHEYYKLSTSGHIEGYRTYFTVETENSSTYVKTITITESTRAWVLVSEYIPTYVDETFTIPQEAWVALNGNAPYTFMTSVTATKTIGEDTEVGIINDQPTLFANYGFVVGLLNGQTIRIFSIGQPTASVNLTVRFKE